MSFDIVSTPLFNKELKRLSKKYPSIKNDLLSLLTDLSKNPDLGKPLGNNCFKIRIAVSSKNKGKSGGARIITYLKIANEIVYLLSIYDKAEIDTITDKELLSRIKHL